MSKILDYREAMQAWLDGKDLQIADEGTDWDDIVGSVDFEYENVSFWKSSKYRIKPQHKTLWIAEWKNGSITSIYSEDNPWKDVAGLVNPTWIENLKHHIKD